MRQVGGIERDGRELFRVRMVARVDNRLNKYLLQGRNLTQLDDIPIL